MKTFTSLLVLIGFASLGFAEEAKTFFPVSERGDKTTISSFEEGWYSKHLHLMEQPSLYAKRGDKSEDVYRFTLLPTWGDPRCAVVTKRGDKADIQFTRLDGDGGYDPGKLVEKSKRELQPKEIEKFSALFEALEFAKQPTEDPVTGLDGSQWILERLKDGEYHIVVRWTADAYDPTKRGTASFVKLCEWMLATAPKNKNAEQGGTGQPDPAPSRN
ncbi:MAG: hypothetical protein AAGA96_12895 [Verrucomicrobiota bacterium]